MPLLRFTKFTGLVRSHEKDCTFRLPRKVPLKPRDTLHIHVLEKLGMARLTKLTPTPLREISFEQATRDGFIDVRDAQRKLMQMHKMKRLDDTVFDFIEFTPGWIPNQVIQMSACVWCNCPTIKLPHKENSPFLTGAWMCLNKRCHPPRITRE